MQRYGWVRAAAAVMASLAVGSAMATTIASLSPQGEVAQVRQIAVRFSEAVVPLGDLRLAEPVTVQCTGQVPPGTGRWADEKSWVYDFREALPPGTRCSVKARAGWKPATAAAALTGRTEFAFNTGGPAVVSVSPYDGATIEEDQHFLLQLNGPAVDSTVAANAWCEVEGIGERLPVQLVTGAARDAVLKARNMPTGRTPLALLVRCPRPLPAPTKPSTAAIRMFISQRYSV